MSNMISSLSAPPQVCEAIDSDLVPLRPVLLVPSLSRKLPTVVAIRMTVKPPDCTERSWRSMSGTDSATLIGTDARVAQARGSGPFTYYCSAALFPFAVALLLSFRPLSRLSL